MSRKGSRPSRIAGVLDRKGNAQRIEPRTFTRLDKAAFLSALVDARIVPTNHHIELTTHVVLSAQVPWVEDRGYLDLLNPRSVFPDGPNIGFVPEAGQPTGRADAWLHGLEPDSSYLARISVGAPSSVTFDVRAVTLGTGLAHQDFQISGGFDELFLDFDSGDGGLGLLRIECPDWSLYEIEILRFESSA